MAILVLATAVSAGCAKDESADSTSSPATTARAVPKVADPAGDTKAAAGAQLVLTDLPEGYTQASQPASTPDRAGDSNAGYIWGKPTLDCIGTSRDALGRFGPMANSGTFKSPENAVVTSMVEFEPNTDIAGKEMSIVHDPKLDACLLSSARDSAKGNAAINFTSVGATDLPPMGDDSAAIRTTAHMATNDQDAFSDVITVRSGRALVTMTLQSVGQPFTTDLEQQLTQVVLDRLPH
ncbi:hypothetical protein [Nocardia stercoris]|uniref:Sensor domain-containing protein n=1 Tax=Nocardia stercoris TaxID=2483361 RepID=A0A3M2L8W9_9NOCA|nr:hypothetical protein [Nocardia stercoris]RMI34019.1 hypothetical protein EBN03_06125 [Nocardia stercoris]